MSTSMSNKQISLVKKGLGLKRLAFTLAEVLIVMGLIGIVAEMTIPTLMNNVQEQTFKVGAKKAYAMCYAAINQMKQDQGGTLSYYNSNFNTFKPEFIKYFKVLNDCGTNSCVPDSAASDIYTSLGGEKANTTSLGGEGQFVTVDGMFFNIQNNPASYDDIIIVVDVNGYQAKPNTYGKDTFAFSLLNDTLMPLGSPGRAFSTVSYFCNRATHDMSSGISCMYYLMSNISY